MVLFIVAGNRWIVLLGVLLWAVGVSMGFPLGMSAAAESGPDPAARISVVASIGYFANLAGPPPSAPSLNRLACSAPCGCWSPCSWPPSPQPAAPPAPAGLRHGETAG